jgi:hypothetical protein
MYYGSRPMSDFASLVSCYPKDEFNSPTRSTVPLLALAKDEPDLLYQLLSQCDLDRNAALHFEYQVKSPRGQGKASHTDLMVCGKAGCMAIEAKWMEPSYETVDAWLTPETNNRSEVLKGWLDLMRDVSSRMLSIDDVRSVTYQTIHRAASACHVGTPPQLAYLQFVSGAATGSAATVEQRLADLALLRGVLGKGRPFPLRLVEIEIDSTPAFRELERFERGADAASAIRQALLGQRLFDFKRMHVHDPNEGAIYWRPACLRRSWPTWRGPLLGRDRRAARQRSQSLRPAVRANHLPTLAETSGERFGAKAYTAYVEMPSRSVIRSQRSRCWAIRSKCAGFGLVML